MPRTIALRGALVALFTRTYKPFTDSQGNPVAGGSTYFATLVESFDHEPVNVKLAPEVHVFLKDRCEPGSRVELGCMVNARQNRVEYRAIEVGPLHGAAA